MFTCSSKSVGFMPDGKERTNKDGVNMAALRKVYSTSPEHGYSNVATVYYSAEWQEYTVKHYKNGKYLSKADYFTADKADAIKSANMFAKYGVA